MIRSPKTTVFVSISPSIPSYWEVLQIIKFHKTDPLIIITLKPSSTAVWMSSFIKLCLWLLVANSTWSYDVRYSCWACGIKSMGKLRFLWNPTKEIAQVDTYSRVTNRFQGCIHKRFPMKHIFDLTGVGWLTMSKLINTVLELLYQRLLEGEGTAYDGWIR